MAVSVPFKPVGEIFLLIRQQLLHSPEGLNCINFTLLAKLMSHWLTFYPSPESRRRFLGSGCLKRWLYRDGPSRDATSASEMNQQGRVKVQSIAAAQHHDPMSPPSAYLLCFASPKLGMRSSFCSWNCVWKSLPSVSLPYTSLFCNNQNTSRLKAQ